ncbi:MAG: hypothetical protein Rubg2KO_31450 [Rubricoccaceae bacterium]
MAYASSSWRSTATPPPSETASERSKGRTASALSGQSGESDRMKASSGGLGFVRTSDTVEMDGVFVSSWRGEGTVALEGDFGASSRATFSSRGAVAGRTSDNPKDPSSSPGVMEGKVGTDGLAERRNQTNAPRPARTTTRKIQRVGDTPGEGAEGESDKVV